MAQILLIDDDVELLEMLREYLLQEGFGVTLAHEGENGRDEALSGKYQLAVLDVMMPGINGVETLRQIRAQSPLPVLMLTARGDDTDRILGLELGADDYVTKPCTPRELVARIRAILRRTQIPDSPDEEQASIHAGPLLVSPQRRYAEWEGKPLHLTSTEFSLLEILARHAGHPVSKNELSLFCFDRPLTRYDRNIDVHLSSLRQKLPVFPDGRSCIQTVYRQGYQLVKE